MPDITHTASNARQTLHRLRDLQRGAVHMTYHLIDREKCLVI